MKRKYFHCIVAIVYIVELKEIFKLQKIIFGINGGPMEILLGLFVLIQGFLIIKTAIENI